ncbi:MAG: LysM peptidoglycan-binding domain-containing protein [Bacteroidaceae bacterium]|nr:LysM peptidoglycan-binding domain-containing protein [Bacteroidaceae bacterium]
MKNVKIILWVLGFLFICVSAYGQTKHEIKAGETLYSISRTYGVTISAIQAANPGLGETIIAGQTINIPSSSTPPQNGNVQGSVQHIIIQPTPVTTTPVATTPVTPEIPPCKETYEVKKKETLYSIAQRFGVTMDEIVAANPTIEPDKKDRIKKGQMLCIPFTQAELKAMRPVEAEEEEIIIKEPVPVNFAIIMPFGLNQQKKTREAITMIDFYEGIMLAVSEMKRDGVSGKVYAFDEAQIDSVLALPQMKKVNLIIGAKDANNINKLKAFTEKNNISLVVPLSSSTTLVNNTHNVYQVNQKMDNDTYDRAFASFSAMHPNTNYIFVNIEDQTDKADYVMRLKNYLNSEQISYFNCDFQNIANIVEMLTTNKENYIIPSSSTKTAFDRLVKRLGELALDSYRINLFGYTDWQAFADKSIDAFKKYQCMFFTSFYNNPNATETYAFNQRFRSTFGRDQYNTYPRYGMLGYDIANFFVRNMYIEGEDFAANIENLTSEAIQNPMHFTHKNTWSGFINNAMMFVKYNSDGTISVKQL